MNFYNTINLTGEELAEALRTVKKQTNRVRFIFSKANKPITAYKAWLIYKVMFGSELKYLPPDVSIRRSTTDLYNAGILEKLDEMEEGGYGKPNHFYKIK